MQILARTNSQPRELIPSGNYIARCYSMIHIGTTQKNIMGEQKTLNEVRIGWELPTELKVFNPEKGEQPRVISKEYTLSMGDKANLRKMLASWRGQDFTVEETKSFDITKLLGKTCMLNIIHKPSKKDPTKIYEEIGSVSPMPKGMPCPDQINPTVVLSYDDFNWNVYEALPDFIKDKVKSSEEFIAMQQPQEAHISQFSNEYQEPIDDLPF